MESMKCPSCGSPELTKLNYQEYKCESCGTKSKLSEDQKSLIIQQGYSCSNCGFVNESGTSFCGKCGKNLTKFCESCGEAVRTELDFCPKCGSKSFYESITGLVDVILTPNSLHTPKIIEAIKAVRIATGLGLVEAKNLVEQGGVVVSSVSVSEAEELKKQLELYGGLTAVNRPANSKVQMPRPQIQPTVAKTGGGCMSVIFVASMIVLGSIVFLIV